MAKSTPSLLALLGLAAVAGYQNRDKIAEMIRNAQAPGAAPQSGTGETATTFGTGGISGALHDLVERFRAAGRGTTADSWVSNDQNHDLHPDDLEQVVGTETVDELARKTGLPRADILSRLAKALPETVNQLTPEGRLPPVDAMKGLA